MTSRMIGDFRVRCTVVHEEGRGFHVQVWTRRVGASAPEKCWPVPGLHAFTSMDDAQQGSLRIFHDINGVRFNGEPEFSHASSL